MSHSEPLPPLPRGGAKTGALRPLLPWLALVAGFAPSLQALARELFQVVPERICLLAVLLFALGLGQDLGSRQRAPRTGLGLVIGGVLLQLFGFAGQVHGLALLGLPIAVVGMCLWQGRPSALLGCLAFWWIPLPLAVVLLGTPELESAYAWVAAKIASLAVGPVEPAGPLFAGASGRFELSYFDSGYPLAWSLSCVAWYAGLRASQRLPRLVLGAALGFGAGFLLQLPLLVVAVAGYALGSPSFSDWTLLLGPWLLGLGFLAWLPWAPGALSSRPSPSEEGKADPVGSDDREKPKVESGGTVSGR